MRLLVFEDKPLHSVVTGHLIGAVLVVIVALTFYDGIFRRRR